MTVALRGVNRCTQAYSPVVEDSETSDDLLVRLVATDCELSPLRELELSSFDTEDRPL